MATSEQQQSNIKTVQVKWQKQTFENVEIDLAQPATVFKMQLFSLTGVQPERQKIMGVKGGLLKDDANLAALGIKDGQKLTMMGTVDKVPEAPQQEQTFVEDLPVEEQDTSGLGKYGAGLVNLGNTCYMNSTVQCLYAVPELKASLQDTTSTENLTVAARNLFSSMEKSAIPASPMEFVLSLRRAYPQFDARSREGYHMQQDAEECWSNILLALKGQVLDSTDGESAISKLFGVGLATTLKCDESDETINTSEMQTMLKCNITGEINHLGEGIKLGLAADREQQSALLQRNSTFRGEARITRLPPYLTVQMMRFFYKQDVQQKAKILRKVTFPLHFDAYELCDGELKKQLDGPRKAAKEAEDLLAATAKKPKLDHLMDDAVDNNNKTEEKQLTGRYELIGVLTHKGRSADSGHYVAWVKQTDGEWIQFDDDQMIPRKQEEVMTLSGGGDWHMAYLLLYKAIKG